MKWMRSFGFALNGFRICFTGEHNFRIHVLCGVTAIVLGCITGLSATEWIAVTGCIAFVTVLEMINTAIEKLCDMVHKEIHPVIKMVKDISAGAVLLAAVGSAITGVLIFLPKIILLLK
ncbi:diacylglycerol kinase family protein [Ferruginibacter sp.]